MPYVSCEIEIGKDTFMQDLYVPQKFFETLEELKKECEYTYYSLAEYTEENNTEIYNCLYKQAVTFSALFLADGTYSKDWITPPYIITIGLYDGFGSEVSFNEDLLQQFKNYLKVLQWQCPEEAVKLFEYHFRIKKAGLSVFQLKAHRKELWEMRRLAREHNQRYSLTYDEWLAKGNANFYAFWQYKREFDECFSTSISEKSILELGKKVQNEWLVSIAEGRRILSEHDLKDLLRILTKKLAWINSPITKIPLLKEVDKLFNGEEEKPRRFGNSVYTRSVPMGGQGGYKRRIKRK